ncbi:hypothetical protein EXN66_Car017294 [Channa argus]|uniref:Uncharacterized protein n=1 Tax=Channa argus TaxID=215402 RepID=A0A6G1QHN2_CHAAH|nr:hypothetical protein EXN66_Car017294 [Channa argus]KAK2887846.1 hypothetical protein Q8A73_019294 [Channa argus]
MFAATTKAVVKGLGAQRDLISNRNMNTNIEMLTLVKVHKNLFKTDYRICNRTLLDLLEEPDVYADIYSHIRECSKGHIEYTEEVLMKDFTNLKYIHAEGCAGANTKAAGDISAELSAGVNSVDATSSFTLNKKRVDIEKLTELCNDKKIKKKLMDELHLQKKEKLTFVHEIIYNTNPITLVGINEQSASASAAVQTFFKTKVSGIKKDMTSFILPEKKIIAYSLTDIETDDGVLRIPVRWQKRSLACVIGERKQDNSCEILKKVNKELEWKEYDLKGLVYIPESMRRDLLNKLRELLKDRDNLTLLDRTWDQDITGESDCPQSVSSFMELLKTSTDLENVKPTVHLLVSAMDTLPDDLPALLTSCSPDTLRVLNQLVEKLKDDTQTKLPESLPPPLQKEGELSWVVELLCSSGDSLTELNDQWDQPELTLAELLKVLCLVIRGLSLM